MNRFPSKCRRTGARLVVLAAALMLGAPLAGCGPADTGVQRDTAHRLQELVLNVSRAAAANDHAAALTALENLETDVASAAGNGQVSEDRRRSIMTGITAVRADLKAAVEATAAATAKAAEEAAAAAASAAAAEAEKAKADAEAAAKASQENTAQIEPAPVPVPAPAPALEPGKGGEGKGKNKNG